MLIVFHCIIRAYFLEFHDLGGAVYVMNNGDDSSWEILLSY
jgi:hypothetical protein